nr:MAG: hypothetical protein DIU56_16410 [Pseudomonadota bacterium]
MRACKKVAHSIASSGQFTGHDLSSRSGSASGQSPPGDDLDRWLEAHRRLDERMREGRSLADVLDEESHESSGIASASAADDALAAGDGRSDRSHLA